MQRQQAFQFELRPTGEQQRDMRRFAGACRFVFNQGLALQKERFERGEAKLNYAGLCKALTGWRNSQATPWLKAGPVHTQQQALKDLERAYTNFFEKRAAFPRFKKKGVSDSFRYPDPKQIRLDQANSRVFLPKLGWLRYRNSRAVLGELRNVTVSLKAGRWRISVQTAREVEQTLPDAKSMVGVDVGIVRYAVLSDGSDVSPVNGLKHHLARLALLQRRMSRKQEFSRNWLKARARVQKLQYHIANVRRDHIHKATSTISKNHAIVAVEDLRVRNMSASARGTAERPGRNVRAKSALNRSILDQGWFEFRRQLEYKLAWRGGELLAVPAFNTSRMCSCCGFTAAENRPTQAQFHCVACGYRDNADTNAARNVLAAGHAALACGERAQSGRSLPLSA